MKQKLLYTLSVVAALLATACTDDMGVQDLPVETGKGYEMKVAASVTPASRMSIENDGKVVNYYWTDDDAFTVFDFRNNQETEYVIDTETLETNSTKADFIGTPEKSYIDGQKLYAVYNKKNQVQLDPNGNVNFDLSRQNGQLNEEFQYMWGEATYKDGKPLEFVFRHLVTTLQVKMAVPAGVKSLSKVTLHSRNLVSKATLVLKDAPHDSESQFGVGDLVYSYDDNNGYFEYGSITLDGNFTPVDGYVTFYIYTLSAKLYHKDKTWYEQDVCPFILFTDDKGIQHASTDFFGFKNMEVGAVYSLNIEKTLPLVDFENEDRAWGSANEPYQIANADQMFSLMMRSFLQLRDKNTNHYYSRSYQLLDNIVLDTRSLWYSIMMSGANFDGNGKTVSGNMNIIVSATNGVGLFGEFNSGTLKDLNFTANITLVNKGTTYSSAATLVGQLLSSTVQRCFSSAKMIGERTFRGDLGGLVGTASHSTIEYCGFSGSISTKQSHIAVGGIVGRDSYVYNDKPLVINGCYSDGSISIGYECDSFGGIIGNVDEHLSLIISNCWNNTSLKFINNVEDYKPVEYGGIVGYLSTDVVPEIKNSYWSSAIGVWVGNDNGYKPVDCSSFNNNIPEQEQLQKLNYDILSSGLMFRMKDGHLVKNNATGVPPSDIENW